jgi:Protein of unknown function (DUF1553)/Protein of unknown function (DUF1549)/Planctomycete cytochrome C
MGMGRVILTVWTLAGVAMSLFGASAPAHGDDFFQRVVAPILVDRCIACHNDEKAEGDFSVQSPETFFGGGHVEPGDPDNSYLVDLISPHDEKTPPAMPKRGAALSAEQVAAIREWIAAGAVWPEGFVIRQPGPGNFEGWAFRALTRPEVPEVDPSLAGWANSPIDRFVAAKLFEKGLQPSPPARPRDLIRRLSYDLTGLPPTWEEICQFESANSNADYDRLVDRLLASPRYGEHWARHWLDVVRYADTCGYDKDKPRPNAWPYRDYVIRSFNEDKPYARFVREQIAGDVLFPGEPDGVLALGFLAAGPWDFIGHVEVPESKIDGKVARNLDRDEMVSATINTFCSMTIQCARCHDHKFDPFTQEHYYGLQAVFAAVDRADRVYATDEAMEARRKELLELQNELLAKIGPLQTELLEKSGTRTMELDQQLATVQATVAAHPVSQDPAFGYHSQISDKMDEQKWVEVEFPDSKPIAKIVLRPAYDDFAGIGSGFGFPPRFQVLVDDTVVLDRTADDFASPGIEPIEIDLDNKAKRVRVVAHRLAKRQDVWIFALADLEVWSGGENIAATGTVRALDSIEAAPRWGTSYLVDGKWPAHGPEAVEANNRFAVLTQQKQQLPAETLGAERAEQLSSWMSELSSTEKQLTELPAGRLVYAAATDFEINGSFEPTGGIPRRITVLERGEVTSPGEEVRPGSIPLSVDDVFEFQLSAPDDESQRRAALALWLTRDDHPLLWRSMANRIWQYHFGSGIVATANDFGRMGAEPTHPELLDWLACELRDSGGSIKHLHRLIVTSAAYRQSAGDNPEAGAVDAANRWLWRANRRRLSAEEIRDSMLWVSGRLDLAEGGPGYYLFELEKSEESPHYEYQKFNHRDSKSWRRSIYRFVVRSQPDPLMTTLDCADSSQSTPVRSETQTSLQALSLLNNPFNLEMAEAFAARLSSAPIDAGEDDETVARVRLAMKWLVGRLPDAEEAGWMFEYAKRHSLADLARILFNTSEFLYVE